MDISTSQENPTLVMLLYISTKTLMSIWLFIYPKQKNVSIWRNIVDLTIILVDIHQIQYL